MDLWYELGSLVPPVLTGLLFWFVIRAILRADRHEREALREAERQYDAAQREQEAAERGREGEREVEMRDVDGRSGPAKS